VQARFEALFDDSDAWSRDLRRLQEQLSQQEWPRDALLPLVRQRRSYALRKALLRDDASWPAWGEWRRECYLDYELAVDLADARDEDEL
jgi:hypothetical protein